jgi:hypothetical protein
MTTGRTYYFNALRRKVGTSCIALLFIIKIPYERRRNFGAHADTSHHYFEQAGLKPF